MTVRAPRAGDVLSLDPETQVAVRECSGFVNPKGDEPTWWYVTDKQGREYRVTRAPDTDDESVVWRVYVER